MDTERLPRPTAARVAIVEYLAEATAANRPAYGLEVCRATTLRPGTVYAGLEHLADLGWVEAHWEEADHHEARPRRRFFRLTPDAVALLPEFRRRAERTARRRLQRATPTRLRPA